MRDLALQFLPHTLCVNQILNTCTDTVQILCVSDTRESAFQLILIQN